MKRLSRRFQTRLGAAELKEEIDAFKERLREEKLDWKDERVEGRKKQEELKKTIESLYKQKKTLGATSSANKKSAF